MQSATTRAYDSHIRHFERHGGSIPARPVMVAEHLANCAGILTISTPQHHLIAIHRAHTDNGHVSPVIDHLVKRTMQGIRRTMGTKQRRVTALVKDDLLDSGSRRHFGAELLALCYEDMTYYDNGLEMLIRRSKTNQEGVGRTIYIPYARGSCCPVRALKNWLELAGIVDSPLFRPVNRHDQLVGKKWLPAQSVSLICKAFVRMTAGGDAAKMASGHSLRAGYCTEIAICGL